MGNFAIKVLIQDHLSSQLQQQFGQGKLCISSCSKYKIWHGKGPAAKSEHGGSVPAISKLEKQAGVIPRGSPELCLFTHLSDGCSWCFVQLSGVSTNRLQVLPWKRQIISLFSLQGKGQALTLLPLVTQFALPHLPHPCSQVETDLPISLSCPTQPGYEDD